MSVPWESNAGETKRGLCVLSLDGGGIRGLSELLILEETMERIKWRKELREVPKPADHFDLIGGTSTGGIVAILLGRLRLSVADALNAYNTLAKEVFSEKKTKGKDGTFKASKLEEAMKSVIEGTLGHGSENARMFDSEIEESSKCRVFVCATGASDVTHPTGPTLFRSYDVANNKEFNCCIWEAARATTAAPTIFKRIKIGPTGSGIEYVDAGLGYNNPVNQVVAEVPRVFGKTTPVACILSIGTGQSGSVGYAKPGAFQKWLPTKLIRVLEEIATDTGKAAEEMEQRYESIPGIYHRLDVDRGLQSISLDEWEKLGDVRLHTKNYMKQELISKRVDRVVEALIGCSGETCEAGRLVGSIESAPRSPLLINVPNNRVSHFVTRQALLEEISTQFSEDRSTVVLIGMGGAGKTQLALEICQQIQEEKAVGKKKFMTVVWIDASSPASVTQGYKIAARTISSREQGGVNDEDTLSLIKETLGGQKDPWLVVFDNYDDPKSFRDHGIRYYVPTGKHGHMLFTSRHTDTERLGHRVKVSKMREEESLRLLCRKEPLNDDDEVKNAREIASLLGHLALALDQASAYIRARHLNLQEFVPEYQRRKAMILREIPDEWEYCKDTQSDEREARLTAFTTWELSHQQISGSEVDKICKDHLLTLAAFFDNKLISTRYFEALFKSKKPEWMKLCSSDDQWDIFKLRDILAELQRLSLLQISSEARNQLSFSIHPVIRDWIRLRKHKDQQRQYAGELTTALTCYLDEVDVDYLSLETKQETISHIDVCVQNDAELLSKHFDTSIDCLPRSASSFAEFYNAVGRYIEAEELYQRALTECEKTLGPKHLDTLDTIKNLAIVYSSQDRYDEAEKLHQRVLSEREERLGPKHLDTLKTVHNLALVYCNQGRYNEAEKLLQQVLSECEERLGPKHLDTLKTVENLAMVYSNQGRYDEAEKLYQRALSEREERLGPKYPDTLRTVYNLALVYSKQDRDDEAEKLYQRALSEHQERLGPKHPNTLKTVENLALVYSKQGRYDEAEKLYQRVLSEHEERLGPKHPDTLRTVYGLAIVYNNQGRYDEAEKLYQRALSEHEERLGPKHPNTLNTIYNLAICYSDQGRYDEAEKLFLRVLSEREEGLGPKHPDTLMTVHGLAVVAQRKQLNGSEDLGSDDC